MFRCLLCPTFPNDRGIPVGICGSRLLVLSPVFRRVWEIFTSYRFLNDLYFSAIKLTGPFVTMIFSMITGDMFTFSIIYVIFLLGFTQARLIILVQSRPIIFLFSGFLLPHEEYERRTVRWVPHNLDCSLPHDSGRIWGRLFMFGDSGVNNFPQIVSMMSWMKVHILPWWRWCLFCSKSWSLFCCWTCWLLWWVTPTLLSLRSQRKNFSSR